MKDGATDVLGSLKGKMQSISVGFKDFYSEKILKKGYKSCPNINYWTYKVINSNQFQRIIHYFQIKDKFGRFTPKSGRRKTKLKTLHPLSVDASQYRVSSLEHQDSTQENGASNNEEEEEEEEDLIDFSDPTPPSNQFDPFFHQPTTTATSHNTFNGTKDSGLSLSETDKFTSLYPSLDGFSPPSTSSSNRSSNRQSNGSYGLEFGRFPDPPDFKVNGQTNKPSSSFSNWEKFE